MDNAVFETLLRVADSDGTIRTAAENRLKELAVQPGKAMKKKKKNFRVYELSFLKCFFIPLIEYPVSLARITVSQQFTIAQRQISFYYTIMRMKKKI